jgi:hypothetical protein
MACRDPAPVARFFASSVANRWQSRQHSQVPDEQDVTGRSYCRRASPSRMALSF